MIKSTRLVIAEASTNDAAFIYELLNAPTWLEFIGDRNIKNIKDAEDYIQNSLIHSYKTLGHGLYIVTLAISLAPIGICGLLKRDYLEYPDLGFAILPMYEGKGYMQEAAIAVIDDAKTRLQFSSIAAITTKENLRSIKLLKQLGFILISDHAEDEEGKSFLHYSLEL